MSLLGMAYVIRRLNESSSFTALVGASCPKFQLIYSATRVEPMTSKSNVQVLSSPPPAERLTSRATTSDWTSSYMPMPKRFIFPTSIKPLSRFLVRYRPPGLSSRSASTNPNSQPIKFWPFVAIFFAGTGTYVLMVNNRVKEAEQRQEKLSRRPSITPNGN